VRLIVCHPEVAFRDCSRCLKYEYGDDGKEVEWRGRPMERIAKCPAPCRTAKGCPKGTPEEPKTLSAKNMRAYAHYLSCKAVGRWPHDETVERNASIIAPIIEANERRLDLLTRARK